MPAGNVTAVLGPTNTGKTHLAVERMLAHPTGMIGLPLRLLAREVFDKVRGKVGDARVALITGEEKIVPPGAKYWVCTVEAMPGDIDVAFLAIDEVQLAADFERGHVFTDRILHRRGARETMLLGADTMRTLLGELLSDVKFIQRPRLSTLTYAGQKKVSRLPRRSAVVGFSANTVYALAELIRRQRGGAAVVLGALSPRTRNAQVELYQSGDVDYIVATDAIGMGLNMDVDHVAFAATRKFDGFQFRHLNPSELAQVAGRAGRYMNDGTFGVTGEAPPFDNETVEQLESHRFEPVRVLQWRNRKLSFGSLDALQDSLAKAPRRAGLTRAQPAADADALAFLSRDPDVRSKAARRDRVMLLWEVCQIPDYRNISGAEHAHIVHKVFDYLCAGPGRIPADWFARQLSYCDRDDGGIDTLSNRIAHVRTWTFVANRADWLDDAAHWQGRTREIEDKLSDALHNRLSQRFIDRKTAVLMRRLRQREEIMSVVEDDGTVLVENEPVGRMDGLTFQPGPDTLGKPMKEAVHKAVAAEVEARAQAISAAPDPDFTLTADGAVEWQGAVLARLGAGSSGLKPEVTLRAEEALSGIDRDAVQMRMDKFVQRQVGSVLEPLVSLSEADDLSGLARGLAFRLIESYGVLQRAEVADDVKALDQEARGQLRKFGVRFGAMHIFIPVLLKPAATQLRVLLWALECDKAGGFERASVPDIPGQGLTSVPLDTAAPDGFYRIIGFMPCGTRAVRIDMIERLSDMIRSRVFWRPQFDGDIRPAGSVEGGGFIVVPDMMSLVGCSGEEFSDILKTLDFKSQMRPADSVKVAGEPVPAKPADKTAAGATEGSKGAVANKVKETKTADTEEVAQDAADKPDAPVAPDAPAAPDASGTGEAVAADAAAPVAKPAEAAQEPKAAASEAEESVEPADDAPETDAEPAEVEVWWPAGTGPFKARKRPDRPARRNAGQKDKPKARHQGAKRKGQAPHRSGKPDRRIEDSPFAALSALKSQLEKEG